MADSDPIEPESKSLAITPNVQSDSEITIESALAVVPQAIASFIKTPSEAYELDGVLAQIGAIDDKRKATIYKRNVVKNTLIGLGRSLATKSDRSTGEISPNTLNIRVTNLANIALAHKVNIQTVLTRMLESENPSEEILAERILAATSASTTIQYFGSMDIDFCSAEKFITYLNYASSNLYQFVDNPSNITKSESKANSFSGFAIIFDDILASLIEREDEGDFFDKILQGIKTSTEISECIKFLKRKGFDNCEYILTSLHHPSTPTSDLEENIDLRKLWDDEEF